MKIFISYSHKDMRTVESVIQNLTFRGFDIWYDKGIEVGTEWPQRIASALADSSAVIVFMSRSADESDNCRREINFALELKKPMIVVYLESFTLSLGMRLQLGTIQSIYLERLGSVSALCDEIAKAQILSGFSAKKPSTPTPVQQSSSDEMVKVTCPACLFETKLKRGSSSFCPACGTKLFSR